MSNQTNNKLSNMVADDRLAELAVEDDLYNYPPTQAELNSISAELQEYRKASKEPVAITHDMAMAFHNALNDGGIGHEDLEEISIGLRAALANYAAPPLQAVTVPDGWQLVPVEPTYQMSEAIGLPWEHPPFPIRWKRMLAATPQPSSNHLQLGSTTEAASVLDSTTEITMTSSTLTWPE